MLNVVVLTPFFSSLFLLHFPPSLSLSLLLSRNGNDRLNDRWAIGFRWSFAQKDGKMCVRFACTSRHFGRLRTSTIETIGFRVVSNLSGKFYEAFTRTRSRRRVRVHTLVYINYTRIHFGRVNVIFVVTVTVVVVLVLVLVVILCEVRE